MNFLSQLFNIILDFVFPRSCLGCRRTACFLCQSCISKIPIAEPAEEDFIVSVFDYDNKIIKRAIWLLKYSGRHILAKELARPLYEHVLAELEERRTFENFKNPILAPIPLSSKRLRERGYNQSELLVKELARIDGGRNFDVCFSALKKVRETPPQARIKNRSERLKNLKGCFAVRNKERVLGRNIVLVDDISTTGATLREARRTLKSAGAKKVIAITLAH
ncbi:hypothetical protein A3A09_02000 [Candidatus Nomurabacteria bacterium RIFCSPLOWO2_01_FULL_42_20]|uniref:Phosphoribosyltransferase domain-containing protein n=1 Tax=Candidatus Nomurabacteria bacterium RIFCSPHIGHO2_01_FULL_42_16 TaxID=1801743 RepID=A0A1F6VK84_9BACT|nr:MAG: hypothetical protein A2824_03675 [Candidatus Nomurabacteria bacterium RIFCSPHIGHO2_01_FULL_42_16]OGI92163.1 MAG: hypothetical protein A3A09_02000 [Candidatus Nomurabacteria bacterium RIFCSPLOWO2_01_FULL_42_20]